MNVTTGGRYWLASSAPKMGEDTSSDDKTTKSRFHHSSKSSGKSNRTGGMSIASIQSRGKSIFCKWKEKFRYKKQQ